MFGERKGGSAEGGARERLNLSRGIIRNYLRKVTKVENVTE